MCNCSSSCRLLDLYVAGLQTDHLPSFLLPTPQSAERASLTAHTTTQSAASSLVQSASKLFPAPKPSRQGGGSLTLLSAPHSVRYSHCRHRLPLGLQAPGSQPGRSIIKDACASEVLTSLVQSVRSTTVMSNVARCSPPPPHHKHGPCAAFFLSAPIHVLLFSIFFSIPVSLSSAAGSFHLHPLLPGRRQRDVGCLNTHQSTNNLLYPTNTRQPLL